MKRNRGTINHDQWTILNKDQIFERIGFAIATYQGRYIVMAGGSNRSGLVRSATMYNVNTRALIPLPDLPLGSDFQYCQGAILRNYFYVINNYDNRLIVRINLMNRLRWEPFTFDQQLFQCKFISDGNHLFAFSRAGASFYDPDSSRWSNIRNGEIRRIRFATAIVDDKIYFIGGFCAISREMKDFFGQSRHNYQHDPIGLKSEVKVFHIPSQTWSFAPPLPKVLQNAQATSIGRWIVVTGGEFSSNVYIFDSCTQEWKQMLGGLFPWYENHGCVSIGSEIISIGGQQCVSGTFCHSGSVRLKQLLPNWDAVGDLILLDRLVATGRAHPLITSSYDAPKEQEKNIFHRLVTDPRLHPDVFRKVLGFLMIHD